MCAPPVMVAVLLVINTAAVALFQVRPYRRADSVEGGVGALVRGAGMRYGVTTHAG